MGFSSVCLDSTPEQVSLCTFALSPMKNRRATPSAYTCPMPQQFPSILSTMTLGTKCQPQWCSNTEPRLPWSPSGAASASAWSFLQGNGRHFSFFLSAHPYPCASYLPAFSRLLSGAPFGVPASCENFSQFCRRLQICTRVSSWSQTC